MKIRQSIILVGWIAFGIASAVGAEKIEGAFGQRFGEVFDVTTASRSFLTDGTPAFPFSTTNRFRSFEHYYLLVTPITHKIYSICAVGTYPSLEAAREEQAAIMELLTQKYGKENKEAFLSTLSTVRLIENDNRSVMTKVTGLTGARLFALEIRYYDGKLVKVAVKETEKELKAEGARQKKQMAEEAEKAKKSGL